MIFPQKSVQILQYTSVYSCAVVDLVHCQDFLRKGFRLYVLGDTPMSMKIFLFYSFTVFIYLFYVIINYVLVTRNSKENYD